MDPVRPGWHADPRGGTYERWWDGSSWTTATRPLGADAETGSMSSPPFVTAPDSSATPDAYATPVNPPAYDPNAYSAPTSTPSYPQVPTYPGPGSIPGAPVYPGSGYAAPAPYGTPGMIPGMPLPSGVWRSAVDDRPPVSGLGRAIAVCFQRYASFDGRAGLAEFWYFTLFIAIIMFGSWLAIVPFAMFGVFVAPLIALASFGLLLPSLAVTVRRLRDAGYPWGIIFIALIPLGGIVLLVFCAQQSKFP